MTNLLVKKSALACILAFMAVDANAGLTFNTTFTGTVTANEQSAFNYAANEFSSLFSNNITVNITVNGDPAVGLGGSSSYIDVIPNTHRNTSFSYSTVSSAININYGSTLLPSTDPAPAGSVFGITTAEAKALGLLAASTASDGTFSFNSGLSYATDPNSRAAGGYDFIGIAEHEISEIMGRIPGLDAQGFLTPLDLFRYTSDRVLSLDSSATGVYFSLNGGITNLQGFNSQSGADPQDWNGLNASDPFNAFMSPGRTYSLSAVDITTMHALGYQLTAVPLPTSIWLFASALLGLGSVGRRRNKSVQ